MKGLLEYEGLPLFVQRSEVTNDAAVIADANLNVILGGEAGVVVEGGAFEESGSDGIEGELAVFLAILMQSANDCAIEPAGNTIDPADVRGKLHAGFTGYLRQNDMSLLYHFDESAIKQIQAMSQINDRTDDCRMFDLLFRRVGAACYIHCKIIRTLWVMFPEVDSISEPVVFIATGLKCCLSKEDFFCGLLIAAVVAQNERRQSNIQPSILVGAQLWYQFDA